MTAAAHRRHETGKRGDLLSDGVTEPVGVAGWLSMRASISLAVGALGRTASAVPTWECCCCCGGGGGGGCCCGGGGCCCCCCCGATCKPRELSDSLSAAAAAAADAAARGAAGGGGGAPAAAAPLRCCGDDLLLWRLFAARSCDRNETTYGRPGRILIAS